VYVCMCVCVCERERARESVCVKMGIYASIDVFIWGGYD